MSRQHAALASHTMPRKTPQSTAAGLRAAAARPATDRRDTSPGRKPKSGDGRGSTERTKTRVPSRSAPANIRVGCDLGTGSSSITFTIRRHINEIRNCYELELQKDHGLAGRVVVKFSVRPDGSVRTATVASSTLGNATVESCVVASARRWQFPAVPGRGEAIVTYPFVLTPSQRPSRLFGRDDR
jgi:TonB family protein